LKDVVIDFNNYNIFAEKRFRKQHVTIQNLFIISFINLIDMQISELVTALPKDEYSTENLIEAFPCQLPDGVRQNVLNLGVAKRYLINNVASASKSENILSDASLVNLCAEACEKAMKKASLSVRDVGYFVAAYDVNPFLCPGLSQLLVRKIGFNPYVKHINAQGIASIAFPKALEIAENYLAAHPEDYVLLCISGASSYWFQNQVRGLNRVMEIRQINQIRNKSRRLLELRKWIATMEFFLFGDGVAACIVARDGEGLSVEKIVEVTNLGKKDHLAGYARLAALNEPFKFGFYSHLGKEIPELGAKYTALALKRLLGKDMEKITRTTKKWVVHTGSEKILDRMAKTHGIHYERIRESHEVLREYGNLAGASLPFILERIVSGGKLSRGDTVLMVGYGWGFSASASLLRFNIDSKFRDR
jgi:predicted naringenin-chalcone synthase